MPIEDFEECFLYDQIEPLGDLRGDLQAGIIAATIANFSGKVKSAVGPAEFMPLLGDKTEERQIDPQSEANRLHEQFLVFKRNYELKKQLS